MHLIQTGREVHPCVYLTPEDVKRAKQHIESYGWAKACAEDLIRAADTVAGKDPGWIRRNCPEKGAAFAYGFTGCPICSEKWGTWGGADCSFDRPSTVKCGGGHILPNADHPDEGTGYTAEDGRIHYFVGSYNAWVVETYQKWCRWLSLAYTLTGEETYAQTCAVLLDAIAEIYPACDKGSWDYPSIPPSGRLCRPWYQVARVLVTLVDFYDKIHNSPALDHPSFVEGLTRRKNIEDNMLKNGAWYCYEESLKGGMHNGEADYIRGALAVGCLLGIEAYVAWAVDGPYGIRAMINNNADRDGRYIESSLGYARHARELYLTFAEPLLNYRSRTYPKGLNLYDNPTFRSFYILPMLSMDCAGHTPRYGDWAPDTKQAAPPDRPFDRADYAFAERIFARATDPAAQQEFADLLAFFSSGDPDRLRTDHGDHEWLLFHARPIPRTDADLPSHLRRAVSQTALMGQKGIAILRTPPGESTQACLFRYGPVLNHGHYDDLNLNYFALGYELTYDLGYGNGATHTQNGWAKQTAAHQLVLVDETRQQSDTEQDDSGGSLHLLAGMPGLQVADADAAGVYRSRGVTAYRRFLALAGTGPDSYLLDIFSVTGGQQHDYLAHALSTDIRFEGVRLDERQKGSVAGPDINWGERQLNDGYLDGVPHENYWVAPPGNGLGFLAHPRRGAPEGPWSATWRLPDGNSHLRLTVLPQHNDKILNAWAPGIYPNLPKAEHILVRRTSGSGPLKSVFVAIREPYTGTPFIERVEKLPAPNGATALAVHRTGGPVDRFFYAGTTTRFTSGDVEFDGSFGHLCTGAGRIVRAHLIGNTLRAPGFGLALARAGYTGEIVRIDYKQNRVYVNADLPADGRLNFETVRFDNPAYTRNTAYTIYRIFKDGNLSVIDLGPQKIILGQGILDKDPSSPVEMTSLTQHDYARGLTRSGVDFFNGKMLASEDLERRTRIATTRFEQPFELTVESTEGFKSGDIFYYLDLSPGDTFSIHNWATLEIQDSGQPRITATDDVTLSLNGQNKQIAWSG